MSLVLDTHREFLSDEARMCAFRKAIEETVRPGHRVVDLGAGTGIFGLMACRAGAERVYSIEADAILGLSREVALENGFADRIRFVRGLSSRIELPERVDIVISDQMGRFGFEAGVVQFFHDARQRFLKPSGVLLPASVDLWMAPASCPERQDHQDFWSNSPQGFDFRAATSIANNTGYPVQLTAESLRATQERLTSIDFYRADGGPLTATVSFEISSPGVMHGLGGWFQAQLSRNVTLTNSPLATDRIQRRNVFFPLGVALPVEVGDRVSARLRIVPAEVQVSWTVSVETGVRAGKAQVRKFARSTALGMLLSREDLEKTKLDSVPRLTAWGEARRTVVELIDGKRCLGDVEREVQARHPELFPARKDAAVFVAEVVSRYTY